MIFKTGDLVEYRQEFVGVRPLIVWPDLLLREEWSLLRGEKQGQMSMKRTVKNIGL